MHEELDRILHQPIRTRIMAYLLACGSSDYTTIKKMFLLTDGHMTTHMRELLACKYIVMEKEFINNRPRTTYFITPEGKEAFRQYVIMLKKIISM